MKCSITSVAWKASPSRGPREAGVRREWEKRIFGIHVAMMGLSKHLGSAVPKYPVDEVPTTFKDKWTWADLRTGAEAMNPFDYFKFRYYEKWLGGITQFFIDRGMSLRTN